MSGRLHLPLALSMQLILMRCEEIKIGFQHFQLVPPDRQWRALLAALFDRCLGRRFRCRLVPIEALKVDDL